MFLTMAPNVTIASSYSFLEEEKKVDWEDDIIADDLEYRLRAASAVDRVRMVVDRFGSDAVTVLTSFGVQSGVMLALVAEACPEARVMYINTQGPTSELERDLEYGHQVLEVLGLKNFTVAKADVTREEFRQGMEEVGFIPEKRRGGEKVFHALSQDVFKVMPLKQECAAFNVKCLLSGVRRGQTKERDHFNFLQFSPGSDPAKAHPILDWSDQECLEFLRLKNVPPHPELSRIFKEINQTSRDNKNPKGVLRRNSSFLRSNRPTDREEGKECGIHVVQTSAKALGGEDPVPPMPNMVIGKVKCRFCVAAKELLADSGIDFVEAPVHLFPHLIPAGTTTVPVVYLNKQLIGGYSNLCEHLGVEDTLNKK